MTPLGSATASETWKIASGNIIAWFYFGIIDNFHVYLILAKRNYNHRTISNNIRKWRKSNKNYLSDLVQHFFGDWLYLVCLGITESLSLKLYSLYNPRSFLGGILNKDGHKKIYYYWRISCFLLILRDFAATDKIETQIRNINTLRNIIWHFLDNFSIGNIISSKKICNSNIWQHIDFLAAAKLSWPRE